MTKKIWVDGERITPTELSKLLQDLKDETLYGGVATKTADYTITDTDGLSFIFADGSSAAVTITLPAAAGTGRLVIMTAKDVSNAVKMACAGEDVINTEYTGYTFIAAWGIAILVDIAEGQWVEVFAVQASSS